MSDHWPNSPLRLSLPRIRIGGQHLPGEILVDIVDLTVELDVAVADVFAIRLEVADTFGGPVRWLEDEAVFPIGAAVEIRMGSADNEWEHLLMAGEITGFEAEFAADGRTALTVRGYDRRHRLQRGRRTRTFRNSKDSVIVQHIASEYGLSAVCENSELEHEYVLQDNLSDFDFLVGRAEAIGFELLVEDRKLIFRRRRHAAAPTLSLALGEELLRFEPRLSTVGQATEVIVRGWDCDDQKAINGSSGPVKQVMGGRHSGDAQAMAAFGKAVHVETTRPVASQLAAEHAARSLMTRMALDYVTGEGSCAGRPELRAGAVVALTGLGRRFSGNYYLVRVTHRFMSEWHDRNWRPNASHVGWETHFQVRRNAT